MKFEVVGDAGIEQLDAVPTHDKGSFIVSHSHYGDMVTNRIELTGVTDSDIAAIKTGDTAVSDTLVKSDPEHPEVQRFAMCAGRVSIGIPGSGNTVSILVHEVQEVEPFTASSE